MPYSGELPGYYYDQDKDKYFRIQANHRAPQGAAHSQQNVNAKKRDETIQREKRTREERENHELIKRTPWSKPGASTVSLRLGRNSQSNLSWLSHHYGSTLQCHSNKPHTKPPGNRTLNFSISQRGRLYRTTDDPAPSTSVNIELLCPHEEWKGAETKSTPERIVIHRAITPKPGPINAINPNYLFFSQSNGFQVVPIDESGHYDSGRALIDFHIDAHVWGIACHPESGSVALATSKGLRTASATTTDFSLFAPPALRHEQICVSYKEANVIMSGQRNGHVNFTDTRQDETVIRLKHSSAITGIDMMRNSNHVIVGGLSSICIYDLRFAPEVVQFPRYDESGVPDVHPVLDRGCLRRRRPCNQRRQFQRHLQKAASETKYPTTKELLAFNLPSERKGDQYRAGSQMAYSPSLNIAVLATNSSFRYNTGCVTLFDCSTGKMIDSPLTRHAFGGAVNEIKIGRVRDGPEDLFVLAGLELQEWSMYHRATESGQEPSGFLRHCKTDMVQLYDNGNSGPQ